MIFVESHHNSRMKAGSAPNTMMKRVMRLEMDIRGMPPVYAAA